MRRSSLEYIIPAVLALFIGMALFLFIPRLSTRYSLKVGRVEESQADYYRHYHDFDGDGTSEIIDLFYNASGNLSVRLRHLNEATINQFNLPGKLTKIGAVLDLHDISGDGIADIMVCSEKNDTLYLTIIDDIFSRPTKSKLYALDPINRHNDNGDYSFIPGGITDLNGDGTPEYVLAINGGHSLQPRRVYAIDYLNNRVGRSPVSGAAVHNLGFFDMNGNGVDEILLSTTATENFKNPFPYMDNRAWLMVLDNELEFYMPPIALSDCLSFVDLLTFTFDEKRYLLANQRIRNDGKRYSQFTVFDESYRPVSKRIMARDRNTRISFWRESESIDLEDLKVIINKTVYTFDLKLVFVDSVRLEIPKGFNQRMIRLDVDGTGEKEYVYPSNQDLVVLRSDLSHPAVVEMDLEEWSPRCLVSIIENGEASPILFVHGKEEEYYLNYQQNWWFKYSLLTHPGIIILLFILFYLLGNLQNRLVRRRYEKDRLINELQLQSIKNQLDPHFTYNALNAVGSLIYKGEKDQAYQYLKGLTDLLRMVSGDASDVSWTLSDELNFVYKFLAIEKLRFRNKFVYSIEAQDEFREMKVPKLSVLTFVENALKHGLRNKENNRKLEISIVGVKGGMKIEIRDNGIGRNAAASFGDDQEGNGIKMMKRYFKQFNEATGREVWFDITDLYEKEQKPAGTLVEIYIS